MRLHAAPGQFADIPVGPRVRHDGDRDFEVRREVGAAESGAGDAHDGGGEAVDQYLPAGDIGSGLELILPHVPGDDGSEPARNHGLHRR